VANLAPPLGRSFSQRARESRGTIRLERIESLRGALRTSTDGSSKARVMQRKASSPPIAASSPTPLRVH